MHATLVNLCCQQPIAWARHDSGQLDDSLRTAGLGEPSENAGESVSGVSDNAVVDYPGSGALIRDHAFRG
jgi:hypothetical protein